MNERKYKVGDRVTINASDQANGMAAVVTEAHPWYPSQKWYEVQYCEPLANALFAAEFPYNATHGMYREAELVAAE
jgi:hypothetical protein